MARYDLFISYCVDPDYELVRDLEGFLEGFHQLPSDRSLTPLDIWFDGADMERVRRSELPSEETESELSAILVDALENSAQLLVICSANARESKWVALELGWFLENRGPQNVLLAVSEGSEREPQVFPPLALEYRLDKKPWYDFRGFRFPDAKGRLFDDERIKLAAHLYGKSPAALLPIWQRQQRLVLDRAEARRLAATSRLLAPDDPVAAALLARHAALTASRQDQELPEVRQSLQDSLRRCAGFGLGAVRGAVTSAAMAGDQLFCGDDLGEVTRWDLGSTVPQATATRAWSQPGRVNRIACSSCETWLASGSGIPPWSIKYNAEECRDKSELVVWHLPGEKVVQRIAHRSAVVDLVFHRHKPVLFTANTDGYVTCWDLEQDLSSPLFERQVVQGPIRRITLSPQCDYVVAATGSPVVIHFGRLPSFLLFVDAQTGDFVPVNLEQYCDSEESIAVNDLRFLDDAMLLVVLDRRLLVFELLQYGQIRLVRSEPFTDFGIRQAVAPPDSSRIALIGEHQVAILYPQSEDIRPQTTLDLTPHYLTCATYTADGSTLCIGTDVGIVHRWREIKSFSRIELVSDGQLAGHTGAVRMLSVDPAGAHMISGGEDRSVRDFGSRRGVWTPVVVQLPVGGGTNTAPERLETDPTGQRLFCAFYNPERGELWNIDELADPHGDPRCLALRPFDDDSAWSQAQCKTTRFLSATEIVVGTFQGEIKIFDIGAGELQLRWTKSILKSCVNNLWACPISRALLVADEYNYAIYDSNRDQILQAGKAAKFVAAVSADGDRELACWSTGDSTIYVCDMNPYRELCRIKIDGQACEMLTVDTATSRLAFVTGSRDVYLVDLTSVQDGPARIDVGQSRVRDITFAAGGQYLVTGSNDATVRVYDIAAGTTEILRGIDGPVQHIAVADRRVLAVSEQGYAWDLNAQGPRKNLIKLGGHPHRVLCGALTPDGRIGFTGSVDGAVRLWILDIKNVEHAARYAAGRNLNRDEWDEHFQGESYRLTFPDLPECPVPGADSTSTSVNS